MIFPHISHTFLNKTKNYQRHKFWRSYFFLLYCVFTLCFFLFLTLLGDLLMKSLTDGVELTALEELDMSCSTLREDMGLAIIVKELSTILLLSSSLALLWVLFSSSFCPACLTSFCSTLPLASLVQACLRLEKQQAKQ